MTSEPIILGFDTSARHCTAALLRGRELLAHKHEEMTKGQAERLMDLLAETLDEAGVDFSSLSALGVGVGPGNFTGIRIAVSAARGLALGLGRTAVGVSGFEALKLGTEGPCTCAIAAHRDHVFLQQFDASNKAAPPELASTHGLQDDDAPMIGEGGRAPVYPTAHAIALIALKRYATETEKPAPLYLRPADAAPARDTAPTILS